MGKSHGSKTYTFPGHHSFFEKHGWLVLRGVVSAERIEHVTELFEQVVRPLVGSENISGHAKSIWQIPGMCRQNEGLLAHFQAGLGELVSDLLGARRVQLLQDALIVKPARIGAPIELHQDYTYTGFLEPPNAVSVRLSLTASTVETGCMYVIDRSHMWGLQGGLSVFSDHLQQEVAEQLPVDLYARIAADRVPLELNPGDVSIHHCLTFHGSFENTGDRTQRIIVSHVYDSDCRLSPDLLPGDAIRYFDTDASGHLSATTFPVLFERRPA